jgi:hypothetical protein
MNLSKYMFRNNPFDVRRQAMHPEMTILLARQRCAERVEEAMLATRRGVGGSRTATGLRAVVGRGLVRLGTRLAPANVQPERGVGVGALSA